MCVCIFGGKFDSFGTLVGVLGKSFGVPIAMHLLYSMKLVTSLGSDFVAHIWRNYPHLSLVRKHSIILPFLLLLRTQCMRVNPTIGIFFFCNIIFQNTRVVTEIVCSSIFINVIQLFFFSKIILNLLIYSIFQEF